MKRFLTRYNRLLATAVLLLGAGCEADENRIPGDTRSNPVAPAFLFLDVRASQSAITAGNGKPVMITVEARFSTGQPVDDATVIDLTTTLGSFDAPDGSSSLELEIFNGFAEVRYFAPTVSAGGTARIRAELDGVVDTVEILIRSNL